MIIFSDFGKIRVGPGDGNMEDSKDLQKELEITKAALESLKSDYNFLIAMIENLPNPIFVKDEDAKFIFFNKKYSEFFGMDRDKYLGKSVLDLEYLSQESRERYQKEDLELIQTAQVLSYEADYHGGDGELHPSLYWSSGIYDTTTGRRGLVGEIVDISNERQLREELNNSLEELHIANEKLEKIAEIDPGTGVFNRLLLNRLMSDLAQGRNNTLKPTCALLLDLDHFKEVNDTYGHVAGDEILKQFGELLQSESREHDVPIRYGGDEFILLINNVDLDEGVQIAERIRQRCKNEILAPDGTPLTCSIGVAMIDENESQEKIINKLDARLYTAKLERDKVVIE